MKLFQKKALRILLLSVPFVATMMMGCSDSVSVMSGEEPLSATTSATPLKRFWNGTVADHYYSRWPSPPSGYVFECNEGYVFSSSETGTIPLYQYYSAGGTDHFYSTTYYPDLSGYEFQGTVCYVYDSYAPGRLSLYRWWSLGGADHFYTTSYHLTIPGYVYEGIACWVKTSQ